MVVPAQAGTQLSGGGMSMRDQPSSSPNGVPAFAGTTANGVPAFAGTTALGLA